MCAIAGILGLPEGNVPKMLKTMTHRGPDANGVFRDRGCSLLHARLTVIDPAGGGQPMTWDRGDERFTIVYNGELYITEDLRRRLRALGHRFEGRSDTEVLLHAYTQWGEECLGKLNGIYAFGIWEQKKRRLFLARDRMGVKPLFYKCHGEGLLFASEIKTILAYPTVEASIDREGAAELLLLGPGRTPGCGVFKGIFELEPGCCGVWEDGRLNVRRYWRLLDREHRECFEETAEQVRFLVTDAIRRQMVSDVPIGTFLSGGLDSSLITAVCGAEMAKKGEKLTTFSVDYTDNDKYFTPNKFQPNSDGHYIRLMQSALDTDHHWCVLTPEELVAELENATVARDLPGMADVDFSLLAFCRRIKEKVTVALSGECADEIFGGYPWYRDPEIREKTGFPWAQNTHQRAALLVADSVNAEDFVREAYSQTCRGSDILPGTSPLEKRMKEMVNLNFRWFMQTLLDRKDRMSMYHGLEVRVPFCDYRIAEYLYGVPWEFKDYQGKEKGLLRQAMTGLLPEAVLWRKKSPYPKTFDPRYTQLIGDRFQIMLAENAPVWALVNKENLCSILSESSPWPWYGQLMRGPQIMAYFLQMNFWLKYNHVDICL